MSTVRPQTVRFVSEVKSRKKGTWEKVASVFALASVLGCVMIVVSVLCREKFARKTLLPLRPV